MGVISFRLSDEEEERLRRAGISPGALAKEKVSTEARRLDAEENLEALERLSREPGQPVSRTVREIRDER